MSENVTERSMGWKWSRGTKFKAYHKRKKDWLSTQERERPKKYTLTLPKWGQTLYEVLVWQCYQQFLREGTGFLSKTSYKYNSWPDDDSVFTDAANDQQWTFFEDINKPRGNFHIILAKYFLLFHEIYIIVNLMRKPCISL